MKDWLNKVPPYILQNSSGNEMFDCVEHSFCSIIYMLTGFLASPRALAKMVGVDQNGSSIWACLYTALTHGLIPYDLWPTPETFDWNTYYSDIPTSVLLDAKFFDISVIEPNLDLSPIWTQLSFPGHNGQGSTLHWVAQINDKQYFDSEPGGAIKPLNYGGAVILSQHSLKVRNMQFKTQNYKGELRIILQADSEPTWEALCKVYGVDPKKIDEIIN